MMAGQEDGFLDDIGDAAPATEPASEPAASEPRADAAENVENLETAENREGQKGAKTDPANDPKRPDGYVPKQALDESRNEIKREREARERAEANFQKFLDRFYAEQQQAQPKEAEVDPDDFPGDPEDYIGQIEWLKQQYRNTRQEQRQQQTVQSQQVQQQRLVSQQAARLQSVWNEQPVLKDAYNALLESWAGEMAMQGYVGPELTARVNQIESQWAVWAASQGKNIEEVIWGLAHQRGFRPPAEAASGDEGGKRATQDPETGRFVSPDAEKAAKLADAQERNGSLSQAPGAPVEKLSAKDIAKMSEDEMWRHFEGNSRNKDWDRSMGFRS